MAIADGIEIFGYVFGFWLFVFSEKIREIGCQNFQVATQQLNFSQLLRLYAQRFVGLSVRFGLCFTFY